MKKLVVLNLKSFGTGNYDCVTNKKGIYYDFVTNRKEILCFQTLTENSVPSG